MSDSLLSSSFAALDLVLFERLPNAVFMQLTPSPRWFSHAFGVESQGQPITLSQAFPFLDAFLEEAERHWATRQPEGLRSEPFTAPAAGGGDVLLRATAVTAGHSPLLVLERLIGFADPRALLQTAREKDLAHEHTRRRLSSLRPVADALRRAADDLAAAATPAQREAVERVRTASARLVDLLDGI